MEKGRKKRSQTSKKKSDSNKNQNIKKISLLVVALAIIGVAAFAGFSASVKGIVKEWDNKIYPGVSVQDIDLGGTTKEEAKNKLNETLVNAIGEKKLPINIEDKEFELIYSDIIPTYDIDGAVDKAYNFGKEHGNLMKYKLIKGKGSDNSKIPLDFSYDENKLKEFEEKIQSEVGQKPKNATLNINGSDISIQDEVDGKTINLELFDQKLKEAINGDINSDESVTIELESSKPKITREDLSKVKGIMGSFSTNYGSSPAGRSHNIEISTKAIDGTIIMPGEIFSFNDVVGDRTAERGYQEAGTYVGNKVEPGIGGGICQVSTTIYRAAMKANLRSVERTNHSMAVGYAQPGLDATVAYGYLDYKFKNSYDFPIYIQGIISNKIVTYNIYGDPSGLNGKTYDMVNEILETIPPQVKVVEDNTLEEGKEINEGGGMTGYKARSYQITYENGKEVNRELIGTDIYANVDTVIKKGTKPAETETQPETPPVEEPKVGVPEAETPPTSEPPVQ